MNTSDVYRVMRECRNYFETGYLKTQFTIAGGVISPGALFRAGAYIAITGSLFHNGVFLIAEGNVLEGAAPGVADETFVGRVYFLCPPAGFLDVCQDIAAFIEKTPKGGYESESFGDYSYTRASGKSGGVLTWKQHFMDDLAQYRRMFTEVDL